MFCLILVGAIHSCFVAAGQGNGTLELIGNPDPARSAEELHHANMYADPVGEFLARCRFGVGITAGAQRGHEQLDWFSCARPRIRQFWPFAGKVDEGLLAGAVHLPHRGLQFLGPPPVDHTELAVGISLWIRFPVLFPEQVEGDSNTLQLLVDPLDIWNHPFPGARSRAGKQPRFKRGLVQFLRQRPFQPCTCRPSDVLRNRPYSHSAGSGDGPVAEFLFVFES